VERGLSISQLTAEDLPLLRALNALFGREFNESQTYGAAPPANAYLRQRLADTHSIVLVALIDGGLAGGLVAYELPKFERERSEIYIYDLAVAGAHRRQGIATKLIGRLVELAAERNAWVVFVQADYGDAPAIALYEKLGAREDVMHFDIRVGQQQD
jgi:aminoglycoside 3-N-acetyltransferase I